MERVPNFIPQDNSYSAPRRVNVTQPTFEQAAPQTPYSFSTPPRVEYEQNDFNHANFAGSLNMYETMYKCVISPALITNIHVSQPPIPDTFGFTPAYGNARGEPKSIRGIASTPKRDALLSKPVRPVMAINSLQAPMMKMKV